jgi:hypothetical protein
MQITSQIVSKVLETVDAGLVSGLGIPKPGSMCVEAAVCYALGLPHGDDPQCVAPSVRALKIRLNDSNWSSSFARAHGLRKLAVLQLGTKDALDEIEFAKRTTVFVVNVTLADLLELKYPEQAKACRKAKTLEEAANAATYAANAATYAATYATSATYAASAADAATYAAAAADAATYAAAAATYAAAAATYAAAAATYAAYATYTAATYAAATYAASAATNFDEVLQKFSDGIADILIDMGVPAVKFLKLLD